MCKFNPKNKGRRIDPCMRTFISSLNALLRKIPFKIVACCCGHGKYPMTCLIQGRAVSRDLNGNERIELLTYDLFSDKIIHRRKKFYKRDKEGYYYIPEVLNG